MSHIDPIIDKIILARVGLLLKHPFFGNIATRLMIKECSDWCGTAATDGRSIFFNREFFTKLTEKQVEFVIAHEILHNIFDHFSRKDGRKHKLFNIACDFCVNGILIRDKIGEPIDNIFHDTKYDGWTAENVYDDLLENIEDLVGQLVDEHIDWTSGSENGRPSYTEEELKEIRDGIRASLLDAASNCNAGNIPKEIARLIEEFTQPKMNWREILNMQIQSTIKDDFSFMRPNRKSWHLNAILPGSNVKETIDICIAIDMSGSIGNKEAKDFLSEIKGIMEEFQDFKIKLWTFDTKVYNEADFDSYNISDFVNYEVIGGGGTSFEANWDYMKENNINPKKFIMFTDGCPCGGWGDESYCDTIFVIHGNNSIVAPFGVTCYYTE